MYVIFPDYNIKENVALTMNNNLYLRLSVGRHKSTLKLSLILDRTSFFINAYNIGPSFTGEFEDTKGVIGIHKSKKDKQHNGKKKEKRTK